MHRNISDWERAGSLSAGTRWSARLLRAGREGGCLPLLPPARSYCAACRAIARSAPRSAATHVSMDTREALGGIPRDSRPRGHHHCAAGRRGVSLLAQFSNLPRFMTHLERVEELDRTRSRWTARGPAGTTVSWEAHIINEVTNEVIGWRSVGDADVVSAGSVHFNPTPAAAPRSSSVCSTIRRPESSVRGSRRSSAKSRRSRSAKTCSRLQALSRNRRNASAATGVRALGRFRASVASGHVRPSPVGDGVRSSEQLKVSSSQCQRSTSDNWKLELWQ